MFSNVFISLLCVSVIQNNSLSLEEYGTQRHGGTEIFKTVFEETRWDGIC